MTNQIKSFDFFLGGHATFTVSNPSGEHYTFRINQPKATDGQPKPFFIGLLSGPDNESSFTYLGMLLPEGPEVRLTRKSKMTAESKPVRVVAWALRQIAKGAAIPPGYAIQHEGKCCRCGRKLTTPESIDRGIGPECLKIAGGFAPSRKPAQATLEDVQDADAAAAIRAERANEQHHENRGDDEEHRRDAIGQLEMDLPPAPDPNPVWTHSIAQR